MDFQVIVVGLIVFAALIYVGANVWRKIKSFSAKSSCELNCGCDNKKSKTARLN